MSASPNITLAKTSEPPITSLIINNESKSLSLFNSSLYRRNYFFDDSSQPLVYIGNNIPHFYVYNKNLNNILVLPLLLNNNIKYYQEKIPVTYSFDTIKDYIDRIRTVHWICPFPDNDTDEAAFNKKFNELYNKWREETMFDSFIGDPYHKCYDKIVRLGYRSVPYIITKLKKDPSLIFKRRKQWNCKENGGGLDKLVGEEK